MSKKRKTIVPQFNTSKKPGQPTKPTMGPSAAPPPVTRIKPQSTSAKSGHRG